MLFQKNMDEKEEGQLGLGCCSVTIFRFIFDLDLISFLVHFRCLVYQTRAFRQKSEPFHPIGAI